MPSQVLRDAVPLLIAPEGCELFRRNARRAAGARRQGFDQRDEWDHAHTLEAVLRLELLHRRARALAPFLAVERERDGHRFRTCLANDVQRFTDGSARGDHVIDDHYTTAQRRADDVA